MRILTFTAGAFLLASCSASPPNQASSFHDVSHEWLAGRWVADGESCESDAVFNFYRDGRWEAELERGTWWLVGNQLTIVTNEATDDENREAGWKPLATPVHDVEGVAKISSNAYRSTHGDGSRTIVVNCGR